VESVNVRTVVPRWVQLVVLPLAIVAAWLLARAAGKVLLLFIVASIIGLILNPVVEALQRHVRMPRGLGVLTVYLGFFLTLAGIGLLLANPVSNQVDAFAHHVPKLAREAEHALAGIQKTLNGAGLHVKLIGQGKTALQTLKSQIVKSSSSLVSFGGGLLAEVAGAIVDVVLVFVVSVYMLIYGRRIGALVRRLMPPGDGSEADDYPQLIQRAVSRYVGGQLLFSLIMGTTAGVALYVYGVLGIFPAGRTYAVAFGAFLGFMELIPYIGPVLGALPPVLVALFTEPISALWVGLLFLGIQQFEGHIVAPQIFGHTLRINPLLVIFGLLVGQQIYGVVGALVAIPILAVLRETVVYLNRHLALEPWRDTSSGGML
jgi:putative heme transporter